MGDHSLGDHWGITGNFEGGHVHLWALGDHWGITAGGITGGSLVTLRAGLQSAILFSTGKNPNSVALMFGEIWFMFFEEVSI